MRTRCFSTLPPAVRAGLFLVACLVHAALCAQTPFTQVKHGQAGLFSIEGVIVDQLDQAPIEFATVVVRNAADSVVVAGDVTDSTGRFRIGEVPPGRFYVTVSFLGYQGYRSEEIALFGDGLLENLRTIRLVQDTKALSEVVVRGSKSIIERQLGKIIVNVSAGAFKTTANAFEVLARSPSIVVDRNGALSVRGMYRPQVRVNGKEVSPEELRGIASEEIEQVEIITNPSAQYDGDSQAVINIRLKKNKVPGISGNVYAQYAQNLYAQHEEGFLLNYKRNRLVLLGKFEYFGYKIYRVSDVTRTVGNPSEADAFAQSLRMTATPGGQYYRLGADYDLSNDHVLGFMLRGYGYDQQISENSRTHLNNAYALSNAVQTYNDRGIRAINLNYTAKLDTLGRELVVNADHNTFSTLHEQNFRTVYDQAPAAGLALPDNFLNNTAARIDNKTLKADYVHPLSPAQQLRFGLKSSWANIANSQRFEGQEPAAGPLNGYNRFAYYEHISAAYTTYQHNFKATSIEVGGRLENTISRGRLEGADHIVDRSYLSLLPSLQVQHTLPNNKYVAWGLSRKITRPFYQDLNPYAYYMDSYSYNVGNPLLLPMLSNKAEASIGAGHFTTSVFVQQDRNVMAQFPGAGDTTQVVSFFMGNYPSRMSYGWDVSVFHQVTPWWKTQNYLLLNYLRAESSLPGASFRSNALACTVNATNAFSLPAGFTLETTFYYQSPTIESVYRIQPLYEAGLGLHKSFFHDRLDVRLNASDLFYTRRNITLVQYENLVNRQVQRTGSRELKVRLSYRVSKSTFSSRRRTFGSADEEKRVK